MNYLVIFVCKFANEISYNQRLFMLISSRFCNAKVIYKIIHFPSKIVHSKSKKQKNYYIKILKSLLMENEKHEFHISLEKDIFDKLEAIKDYHGIKNITEIIRFLITKEFREIKKEE